MKKYRLIDDTFEMGLGRIAIIACCILLCCTPVTASAVTPEEQDPLAAMQQVIDQQRAELKAQSEQLKSQQQRLDKQQETLESMQSQLQSLAREKTAEDEDVAQTVQLAVPEQAGSGAAGETAQVAVPEHASSGAAGKMALADKYGIPWENSLLNPLLALDTRPLDVPTTTGTLIRSEDGNKQIRIYGSVRTLGIYDNRQNFHPYDLNIPQVPYGDADVKDWNQDATIKTSKFGLQAEINHRVSLLSEFDFKGEGGDTLRIRHLYGRTAHWLVGQHWSVMNTVPFLPLSIDSHSTSAHLGARKTAVKYLGGKGNWAYQAALENFQPKFDETDGVDASKSNAIPNIAGNISYVRPWGLARFAAMLTSNRVRYDYGDNPRTTSSETGMLLMAGIRAAVSDSNTIKAHIQRADGNSGYGADYSFGNYDMVFNPNTREFQNLKSWGVQAALEHHWTPVLSTSIGAGYMSMDSKEFQPGGFFDHGYKALVNLFYRPGGVLKGLTIGGEVEFAGQATVDGSRGDTIRIAALIYYDF